MAIALVSLNIVLVVTAWLPLLMRSEDFWRTLRRLPLLAASAVLFTVGALVQALFVLFVDARVLTLDYSLRFAAFGIPCGVLAALGGLVAVSTVKGRAVGVVATSVVNLAVWFFLCILH
jgi:hypothetical protein